MRETSKRGKLLALAAMAMVSLSLVAAPSSAGARDRDTTVARAVERVKIVDFAFRPRRIEISRGTQVRWVNRGAIAHTTTSNTGIWDSGTMGAGDVYSRVFKRAGTFRYLCTLHPAMRGRVVVT